MHSLIAGSATIGQAAGPVIVTERAGLFARHGLEVKTRLMGGAKGVVKGLVEGEIRFGNLAAPALLRAGLEQNTDLVFLTGGINQQFLVARPRFRRRGDLVRRFVMAYVEGMHRYRRDRDFTIGAQQEYSGISDRAVAEATYDLTRPGMPEVPYPVVPALGEALRMMARDLPAAAAADPRSFVVARFVREL